MVALEIAITAALLFEAITMIKQSYRFIDRPKMVVNAWLWVLVMGLAIYCIWQ